MVEHVGGVSDRVPRDRGYCTIDIPACEQLARSCDLDWLGFWHLHPEGGGPSQVDLRTAASYINSWTSAWLTVIVVPDEEHDFSGSYSRSPGVIQYVTERDTAGQIVHHPVAGGVL